jgi:predicted O-linked N-acetylglucosamine transferase (SPINDLY family)
LTLTDEQRSLFQRALDAHRRGDFNAASNDYAALLEAVPNHVDAMHMFAMLHHQRGDTERALSLMDAALSLTTDTSAILANRASIHLANGNNAESERDARAALQNNPKSFGAWFNLGLALNPTDRAQAAFAFREASRLRPDDTRSLLEWFSSAATSQQAFDIGERIRRPLPSFASHRDLALRTTNDLERHGYATAAIVVLTQLRRELPRDETVAAHHELERAYARAALLEQKQQTNAALAAADDVLRLAPEHRGARMLRASILGDRGEAQAALEDYRQIIESTPDDAIAGSAMLIAMQHVPSMSADDFFKAHRTWASHHVPVVAARRTNGLDPERPLCIGWLSPRFFSGLVSHFFLEPLRRFDRTNMTHVLYDSGGIEDATTAEFRAAADEWRCVDSLDDAALCDRVRADGIDILVELSGHSPGNRLRALTHRPAPLQVSWLDYFHSTGTTAIDVLISDAVSSPRELSAHYTERVVYLPSGRLCYTPPEAPVPQSRISGPIRFGSFNRVSKINDVVLACWARILAGVPESLFRLKARAFDSADERAYFIARCARHGIANERLELLGYGTHSDTFAAYADVDIALDPFPFSGCATSLDALWMGIPVITTTGETMVSRQTASLLTSLQLEECIASNETGYVRLAIELARNTRRLNEWRHDLRNRMHTALCDSSRHATELSAALRQSWRALCCGELAQSESTV